MPRKSSTTSRKTAARSTKQNPSKARSRKTATAKKPSAFEARIGDQQSLNAAKAASAAVQAAVEERNKAIVAAVKGGTSARQVAIAVGLTHQAVLKIVKAG